jgi:hypothetical protein
MGGVFDDVFGFFGETFGIEEWDEEKQREKAEKEFREERARLEAKATSADAKERQEAELQLSIIEKEHEDKLLQTQVREKKTIEAEEKRAAAAITQLEEEAAETKFDKEAFLRQRRAASRGPIKTPKMEPRETTPVRVKPQRRPQ